MAERCVNRYLRLCAIAFLSLSISAAAEHFGEVTFNGLPVPGATVTASQDAKNFSTITDRQGLYSFPELTNGTWTIEVEMSGFATLKKDVTVTPNAPAERWELKPLSLDQINARAQDQPPAPATAAKPEIKPENAPTPPAPKPDDDLSQRAADGFLINGSMNNGAASPFAQAATFGNNRTPGKACITAESAS